MAPEERTSFSPQLVNILYLQYSDIHYSDPAFFLNSIKSEIIKSCPLHKIVPNI